MLSQQDCKNIIDQVVSYSKLPGCEVSLNWTEDDFIRFANNGITTSGYRVTQGCSITSTTSDKRSGNASVGELTPDALKRGVEQAEQLAAISRPDPESMPALPAQQYPHLTNFDSYTASARGDVMIPQVQAVLAGALKNQLIAAGFIQRSANAIAVANKAGLFGYHTYTDSSMSHTLRNRAGTSSGWATQSSVSLKDLNGEEQVKVSVDKCLRGANRKKLDAGKFTVIFEPAAVADLMGWLGFAFDARDAEQGRSFLSKPNADPNSTSTYLGEKLFPEFITLRSDPFHPKLASIPWAQSLLPNEKIPGSKRVSSRTSLTTAIGLRRLAKSPPPSLAISCSTARTTHSPISSPPSTAACS